MKDSVLDRSLQNLPFFSPDKNMASNDVRSLALSLYTFFKCLKITAPGKHGGQFLEGTHLLLRVLLHFPLHHSGGAGFHAFQEADAKVKSEIT